MAEDGINSNEEVFVGKVDVISECGRARDELVGVGGNQEFSGFFNEFMGGSAIF